MKKKKKKSYTRISKYSNREGKLVWEGAVRTGGRGEGQTVQENDITI